MKYYEMKMICKKPSLVFANNLTGGGDPSTDADAHLVDPNNKLAPIIGGSKTFNVFVVVALSIAVVALIFLSYKQLKK